MHERVTRREYQAAKRELAALLKFYEIPEDLRLDTPKVLSGLWYLSGTIRDTAGQFGTPIFDTLAYDYTLAREERDDPLIRGLFRV